MTDVKEVLKNIPDCVKTGAKVVVVAAVVVGLAFAGKEIYDRKFKDDVPEIPSIPENDSEAIVDVTDTPVVVVPEE